eukprot:COSAG01_NODE_35620_length_529_cov_0.986047_1_plen_119_part_10
MNLSQSGPRTRWQRPAHRCGELECLVGLRLSAGPAAGSGGGAVAVVHAVHDLRRAAAAGVAHGACAGVVHVHPRVTHGDAVGADQPGHGARALAALIAAAPGVATPLFHDKNTQHIGKS